MLRRAYREGATRRSFLSGTASCIAAFGLCGGMPRAAEAQSVITFHNAPDRSGDYKVPGLTFAAAAKLREVVGDLIHE